MISIVNFLPGAWWTLLVLSIVLGAIIGSFLNVVILRFGSGRSLGGRSHCMACNHQLRWWELVPMISYLGLRGRCASCRSPISGHYFIVEFAVAALFGLVFAAYGASLATLWFWIIGCLGIMMAAYDARHYMIPAVPNYLLALMGFIGMFVPVLVGENTTFQIPDLWQLLSGPLIALPFFIIWLASRGRVIGLGDVKLMVGMGWLLGLGPGITAVLFGFWLGMLWIIAIMIAAWIVKMTGIRNHATVNRMIPFGPFLIAGLFIIMITKFDLVLFITGITLGV